MVYPKSKKRLIVALRLAGLTIPALCKMFYTDEGFIRDVLAGNTERDH